jgi:hypothetical protein
MIMNGRYITVWIEQVIVCSKTESLTAAEEAVTSRTSSFGMVCYVAGIRTSYTTFVWTNETDFAHFTSHADLSWYASIHIYTKCKQA